MCDPQTPGARTTDGGLAMASPYGIGQPQPKFVTLSEFSRFLRRFLVDVTLATQ